MPRNVRNFWIELDVDGRSERISTGPRASNGGFSMEIKLRENGQISKTYYQIEGFSDGHTNHLRIAKHDSRSVGLPCEVRGVEHLEVPR